MKDLKEMRVEELEVVDGGYVCPWYQCEPPPQFSPDDLG